MSFYLKVRIKTDISAYTGMIPKLVLNTFNCLILISDLVKCGLILCRRDGISKGREVFTRAPCFSAALNTTNKNQINCECHFFIITLELIPSVCTKILLHLQYLSLLCT